MTDGGVRIYLRGGPWDGHVEVLPDERERWVMPHKPERHGAFYFGTSLGPLPQPAIYQRAYPVEYVNVLTADLIVKKGTRLEAFRMPWDFAVVFDCVSEGGR